MAEALARNGPVGPVGSLFAAPDVRVAVAPASMRWLLQGDAATQAKAAGALGLPAPAALRAQASERMAMLWLGPDEAMIEAATPFDLIAALGGALADAPHALVEVSHRDAALDIEGAQAETLLACAILLDLHESAFPVGACARTLLGKAPALVWRRRSRAFRLLVPRSFAPYARDLLCEGLRGLGPDPD